MVGIAEEGDEMGGKGTLQTFGRLGASSNSFNRWGRMKELPEVMEAAQLRFQFVLLQLHLVAFRSKERLFSQRGDCFHRQKQSAA